MPLSTFQACGAENYNHLKRKDLRNACMSKSQVFVCYSGSYFVARHNADLNLSVTESECVIRLAAFMRNTGIPWAFTYVNHDTESLASANKQELNEVYKSLPFKTSGNLLYPYTQPDVMGRNNQLIEIRNSDGTLNTWLFMIDSNAYTGEGINVYDYIHDDQVDWYADEVSRMNAEAGHTVNSMVFFHIPLQEYGPQQSYIWTAATRLHTSTVRIPVTTAVSPTILCAVRTIPAKCSIPHLSLAAHRDSSAATTTTTMRQSNTRVFA